MINFIQCFKSLDKDKKKFHKFSQTKAEIRRQIQKQKEILRQETGQYPNQLQSENKHIEYGLGKGALLPKIYNRTIDKWRNTR